MSGFDPPIERGSVTSGPGMSDSAEVTRSEEELSLTTRRRAVGRARLARSVETRQETVNQTVPLRREQARIEYLDPPPGDPVPGEEAPAGERWMVLYEEEIVISTRWVARERVRLAVQTVTEERQIAETLRREQVEVDNPSPQRPEPTQGGNPR